ncbi:MAG TPA: hypothetical protein DHV55_10455 [Clostridiaceae bacterium]|nr:hypothetical protein [Clostridiaceae bacterium]
MALEAVKKIQARDLLKKDGIIVIEHEYKESMPEKEGIFSMFKGKKYGNVGLSLYVAKKENGE